MFLAGLGSFNIFLYSWYHKNKVEILFLLFHSLLFLPFFQWFCLSFLAYYSVPYFYSWPEVLVEYILQVTFLLWIESIWLPLLWRIYPGAAGANCMERRVYCMVSQNNTFPYFQKVKAQIGLMFFRRYLNNNCRGWEDKNGRSEVREGRKEGRESQFVLLVTGQFNRTFI